MCQLRRLEGRGDFFPANVVGGDLPRHRSAEVVVMLLPPGEALTRLGTGTDSGISSCTCCF